MRRIFILLFLCLLYITFNISITYSKEYIDLNLKEDEIAITFIEDNILVSGGTDLFIGLKENNKLVTKFSSDIDVLNINNVKIDFRYKKQYYLEDFFELDNIKYSGNSNLIKIKKDDYLFCIYNNPSDSSINIHGCNFLYLFNTENIKSITTDENIDIIFFNEDAKIPTYFIEDIYSKWIDIYKLKESEFVSIKILKEDYQILVIPNE